jgi:hypothetical protein
MSCFPYDEPAGLLQRTGGDPSLCNYNFTRNEFCDGAVDDYESRELQLSFGPSVANFRHVLMEFHYSEKNTRHRHLSFCVCVSVSKDLVYRAT